MKAMRLHRLASLISEPAPLQLEEVPDPVPGEQEILIQVSTCGVCHTELDEIEGRTPPPRLPIIPGHQVIGRVIQRGAQAERFQLGDRVGVGWIFHSTGRPDENLSPGFRATGRDANGGYAERMVVHENYACRIPEVFSDDAAAPLLCAGAVGYRALKLTGLRDGQSLGLMGFGGSAHLVLQVARFLFPHSPIVAFARQDSVRDFARSLGADWAGDINDTPPEPLDAIIDTTPAWTPVLAALAILKPGGRLVINAIRKEDHDQSALLQLSYHKHLWMEREIKTVANVTHFDLEEFLPIAARIPIQPQIERYPLEQANRALVELKQGAVQGAKVLTIARR
ncbi:zinc-dependent alcohol dehydrogenase family protein [Planctomicrobium sp. SH664]|uniref:zinc-dependent alcohol dehydrogenase family protein n=1 Tax=Planctomicrobium sp. SH664 TaxID=3448125 RepID=UPI003F5C510A